MNFTKLMISKKWISTLLAPRALLQIICLLLAVPLFFEVSDYFLGTNIFHGIDKYRLKLTLLEVILMFILPFFACIRIFVFKEYKNVVNYILIVSGLSFMIMLYDEIVIQQGL